jgi:hypothetical protein
MKNNTKTFSEPFANLLQLIIEEQAINTRVVQLLKLDSFRRRLILNKWLEQLRRKGAAHKLMQALSCLFDNDIAEKTLSFLKRKNNNK